MIAAGILAQQQLLIPGGGVTPLPGPEQAVTWVAGSYLNQTDAVSSRSLLIPGSTQIGDLMIATVYTGGFLNTPSGWSVYHMDTSVTPYMFVLYKVAVSGDPGSNVTWSQGVSTNLTVHYTILRGAQPLSLLEKSTNNGATVVSNTAVAQVNPTNKGQFVITFFARLSTNTDFPASSSVSSGWTLRSLATSAGATIRKYLATRNVMNAGDTACLVTMTPDPSTTLRWKSVQLLVGYA